MHDAMAEPSASGASEYGVRITRVFDAPRERVWRAISDAGQFGSWFGVAFDGPFAAGARITGKIVPTTVDAN